MTARPDLLCIFYNMCTPSTTRSTLKIHFYIDFWDLTMTKLHDLPSPSPIKLAEGITMGVLWYVYVSETLDAQKCMYIIYT